MVDGETLKRIVSAVAEEAKAVFAEKLESVILYGSYARGDADDESDIDVMILADVAQTDEFYYTRLLHKRLDYLQFEHDCVLSLCVLDKKRYERYRDSLPFYRNVMNEGVYVGA